jgi:hypothetical protein
MRYFGWFVAMLVFLLTAFVTACDFSHAKLFHESLFPAWEEYAPFISGVLLCGSMWVMVKLLTSAPSSSTVVTTPQPSQEQQPQPVSFLQGCGYVIIRFSLLLGTVAFIFFVALPAVDAFVLYLHNVHHIG